MSHEATNWAIRQRGLRPSAKLVLWHLADRHTPDHGCFPNQERLAVDCEMSRAAVNVQLDELERRGLIRRIRRLHPQTKRQMSTRYILGFERDFAIEPCPDSGHGSGGSRVQILDSGRVQNLDTNSVSRNTTTAPAAGRDSDPELEGDPDDAPLSMSDPAGACLEACGPGMSAVSRSIIMETAGVVQGWLDAGYDLDLDVLPVLRAKTADPAGDRVIRTWDYFTAAIRDAHRRRNRPARSGAAPDRKPRRSAAPGPNPGAQSFPDREAYLTWLAGWINGPLHIPPSAVSSSVRHELVARGLVTDDRLRERQIY